MFQYKKLLAWLAIGSLVFTMNLFMPTQTQCQSTSTQEDILTILDIVRDTAVGTRGVTRGEFAKILVKASGKFSGVPQTSCEYYPDVKRNTTNRSYINAVVSKGWMTGYANGKFYPRKYITKRDATLAFVLMMGYTKDDAGAAMAMRSAIDKSYELGMQKGITGALTGRLTINGVRTYCNNLLEIATKEGTLLGEQLGGVKQTDGSLDFAKVLKKKLSGPYLGMIAATKAAGTKFKLGSAIIYLNGQRQTEYVLGEADVIYYNRNLNRVYSYQRNVTGNLEAITPSRSNPKTVTVDGTIYTLASQSAKDFFASDGSSAIGSKVTMRLGINDEVADASSSTFLNGSFTGVILKIEAKANTDVNSTDVLNNVLTIVDTTGTLHQVNGTYGDNTYSVNQVVTVTGTQGKVTISKVATNYTKMNGSKINEDGTMIGTMKVAENALAMDIGNGTALKVKLSDLAGTTLYTSSIAYLEQDTSGAIKTIFFKDLLKRNQVHGIISKMTMTQSEGENGTIYNYDVTYMVGSEERSASVTSAGNSAIPVIGQVYQITVVPGFGTWFNLDSSQDVTSFTSDRVVCGTIGYPVTSDMVVYYVAKDSTIHVTTLSKVSDLSKYKLKAYYASGYDSTQRVKVIVARNRG